MKSNIATETSKPALLSAQAIAARSAPYLDDLNKEQKKAVESLDGPLLLLAGAGTGKTKALTCRIAHLLNTGRARPDEILSVTFTNKAAREMKSRIGELLGQAVEGMPWLGTFHSISVKLLRRHAELVGLKSNFTILDTDDQIRLIKQLIVLNKVDDKRWPARQLAGIIDSWKNRALLPQIVPSSEFTLFDGIGVELYQQYQKRLLELNAVDFGDLLMHTVTIFQTHVDVIERYQQLFRFILVDEYQDTNVAQYLWLRLIAGMHKNICCVGDDDQSIYGWRGAEVGNILRFEKDFPGAKVVRLEQNYRSTPHILAAASAVIAGNKERLGKKLWTDTMDGEKLRLIGHWDGEEEARWISEEIEAVQCGTRGMKSFSLNQMAILVRASHQMRAFEDRFLSIGLPYRVIGGPRFYERMEIRDALAYFRIVTSPYDDLAFERVINTPKRGVGDRAKQKIQIFARENNLSLMKSAEKLLSDKKFSGKGAKELARFLDDIWRWRRMIADPNVSHVALAEIILDESGYTEMWQNNKTPEAAGRLENLKELVKGLEEFENLQGFLEHVSLILDNDREEADEKISIMTLHAAKGLEFPIIFLPGWEDGLFPSQRSMDESGLNGVEEERRLAYVGITRSEQICTISFAANRRVFGQWQSSMPSRFIDELPSANVEVLTPPGLYGGGFGAAYMQSGLAEDAAKSDGYNSPGWRRLQERSKERVLRHPKDAYNITIDLEAASSYSVGDRIFHQKFGYGQIHSLEGDKYEIEFEKAGRKNVIGRFLSPAEII